MRELSFRIWDKKEKTMFLSPIEIEHLGSWFDAHLPGAIADTGNKIVMQYTGLKDKNGKKIFEGDITKHLKHNTTVVWQWAEYYNCFFGVELYGTQRFYFAIDSVSLELIGNIHDNPELVKEKIK